MNTIRAVLFKVLVKQFYQVNAGFFLIVAGICFGFLSDVEHLALARYFTSSAYTLIGPVAVWMLYAIKIMAFTNAALEKKENEFLYAAAALRPPKLFAQLFAATAQQFIPALLYGAFLIAIARQTHQSGIIFLIGAALLIINTSISILLFRKITHPNPGIGVHLLRRKFNSIWNRPYLAIYPEWIVQRQPLLVAGTKILACLLIAGVSKTYAFDRYDERLLGMGCSLAFSFNLVIVFYYHRFENFHFQLLRSLPIPLGQRLASFIATWIILSFPEIAVVIKYFPSGLSPVDLLLILIFGISTGLLGYASLFIKDITLETFLRNVFLAAFAWIILILFKVPLLLLASLQLGVAILIYRRHFYSFEFIAEINSEK